MKFKPKKKSNIMTRAEFIYYENPDKPETFVISRIIKLVTSSNEQIIAEQIPSEGMAHDIVELLNQNYT